MTIQGEILETFLRLTNKTYPYGFEDELVEEMIKIGLFPQDLQKDDWGNYFYKIGESRTIFASHLDTCCGLSDKVTHVFDGEMIKTDGKTILGADDKAGVTILLHMMKHNVPGLYYFFIGEEVGCIGSGLASKWGQFKGKYDRMISFDRRDCNSVITYQSSSRCCSDAFADALCNELNITGLKYRKDDGGVYTDSAEFVSVIPECTNLSVGYYREHTTSESQNIVHLARLAEACLIVDWESLPTRRDMTKSDFKGYSKRGFSTSWSRKDYGYHDDWYDDSSFKTYDDYDDYSQFSEARPYKESKKTRRSNKKSKTFFTNGPDLIEIEEKKLKKSQHYYDTIIDKILEKNLSKEELEVVKDQYLDMKNDNDRLFYQYLLGNVID